MTCKGSLASTLCLGYCRLILRSLHLKVTLSITADWLCRPQGQSLTDEGLKTRRNSSFPLTTLRFALLSFHSPSAPGHSAAVPLFKPLQGFKWKWVDFTFSRQFLPSGSLQQFDATAVFTNGLSDPARGETSPYSKTSSLIDPEVK